jgi:hypothetical protein
MRRSRIGKKQRTDPGKVARDAHSLLQMRAIYAPHVMEQAKRMMEAAEELMSINDRMNADAIHITGSENYERDHTVSFEEFGSMDDQIEGLGEVKCPGFEDVYDMASALIKQAAAAAAEAEKV